MSNEPQFKQETAKELFEMMAEVYKDVPIYSLTDDEMEELARIDHAKRHSFPSPHEI